ncbi:MAG: MotA/TolQ/ExbB proton channel family protein [Candidatus Cloacimonetes bacterium]|nr:MotA/TolQ/ExbB proton channel family protein [Candidatus Cloacimonadota bacterium]MCF7813970.1 MotA/TolQ/ExbB proton channel family protein [Candidatus Cloacimonadota bacterium]MCF7868814.1 MotA/TolQ/ExbB proton channel family protein [Candidatus Cloacimonadota bacterium]MCF7884073.1 MotA/TolQ/ExbB proton channel family protein [Candidatus Cloacimonadota bacterium]
MLTEIWSFLVKGGILMIPLLICSVLSLAIIIEKLLTLRKHKVIVPEVKSVIENIESEEDIPLALSVCKKHKSVLSNLIILVLKHKGTSYSLMREELSDSGRQEIRSLERGLGILETIAAVAPVLGLLGTVVGMIKVFSVISVQGVGEASALSGGISEALITTAVGLSVGIPALIFYNYFASKAEELILDIENISNQLLKKIIVFRTGEK